MNGAEGLRRRSRLCTEVTRYLAPSRSPVIAVASASFLISMRDLLPCRLLRSAVKVCASAPFFDFGASSASMLQYSSFWNASISCSRSTMSRSATDCTLPADRPRRTFFHSTGLSS